MEVPDGTPEELSKYIVELSQARPRVKTYAEMMKFMQGQSKSLLEAANKILDNDVKPTEDEVELAIKVKLQSLHRLAQRGDETAIADAKKLPEQLKELGLDKYAKRAQVLLLNIKLSTAAQKTIAENDMGPLKEAMTDIKKFVADAGADIGTEELTLVGDATKAVSQVGAMLNDDTIGLATYKEFSKLLKDTENEMAIRLAEQFDGVIRREDLAGNPMPLAGFKLDGKPFNIDELKGKVVLVDFWATWCGPCLGEIPFMTEAHNAYHDNGFEIVGVSVDRDLDALNKFVEDRNTPRIILADSQPDREDYASQASYYGVSGIPTMIPIGKDGKVITTKARGTVLEEELAKIFGPIPKKDATEEEAVEDKGE